MARPKLVLALLGGLGLLGCTDGVVTDVGRAPLIELVHTQDAAESPCAISGVRECAHTFGDVTVGVSELFTFRVINTGVIALNLSSVSLDGDEAFTIDDQPALPALVPPVDDETEPTTFSVRFAPAAPGEYGGGLTLVSDAENLEDGDPARTDDDEDVFLDLSGTGVEPRQLLTPASCDFGEVEVGTAAFCEVTLENPGDEDLVIEGSSFSDNTLLALDADGNFDTSEPGFGRQTFIFTPLFIAPGTSTSFQLFVNPPAPGAMTGGWQLSATDVEAPALLLPLSAVGVAP